MTTTKKLMKESLCLKGLSIKEDGIVTGLVATTHPDRVGDIISVPALKQIVAYINDTSSAGNVDGAYRSVSLYHDWIHENNPALDEAAFVVPGSAKLIELNDGHFGVQIDAKINDYYKGNMTPDEIKYRIDNGGIAGFSIEYNTDDSHVKKVSYNGEEYRYIESFTDYGGQAFARARMIANPHAVIYKEIESCILDSTKEENVMDEKQPEQISEPVEQVKEDVKDEKEELEIPVIEPIEELVNEEKSEELIEEVKEQVTQSEPDIEITEEIKEKIDKELKVKSKIIKTTKEDNKMAEVSLSVKEMKEAISKHDYNSFTASTSKYFKENPWIDNALRTTGIPLKTTMEVKCVGTKLQIVGGLQTKDTLDTTTNTSSYTQSPVEFADLYLPTLIETFNQQTNLFGALNKRDHLMGSVSYGWRLKTDQASSLAVDPDQVTVNKDPVNKVKLQTPIKEYRIGVSVSDYTLHHARASIGDLFMIEVQARMRDLMRDINNDLFTEQVDNTNKILGMEAVADSAGNTSLYGLTRSTANRLAPAAAADTYQEIGAAVTTAKLREAARKVEIEGAVRGNLRFVMNPNQRDAVFELEDGNQRYFDRMPKFGFDGQISYDGIPIIVDSSCQTDAIFVIDNESYYVVISRPPQVIGLAKVGAAEEAYISVYLAAVYENPRRIHMLNTLS